LKLDTALNTLGHGWISAVGVSVSVWVVPTDEERVIARYTSQALVL
jgi:acetate kinase